MLLLCTANRCRSPMAEVLLRRRGRADYESTADELDDLLGRLVAVAWPVRHPEHAS